MFTFMPFALPYQLQLNLNSAVISRPRKYWDNLTRHIVASYSSQDQLAIIAQQKLELDEINLRMMKELQEPGFVSIDLKNLTLPEKTTRIQGVSRIQVYMYSIDPKFKLDQHYYDHFYRYPDDPNKKVRPDYFYQTNIASQNTGTTEFHNQIFFRVPHKKSKLSELEKFRLVYLIQFPTEADKKTSERSEKITEQNLFATPDKYQFRTYYFAKQQLYDPATGLFAGQNQGQPSKSIELKLMHFKQKKEHRNFIESFESQDATLVPKAAIKVSVQMISRQYSTKKEIQSLIEPEQQQQIEPFQSQQVLSLVKDLQSNEVLIYHERILNNLIAKMTQTNPKKDHFDDYFLAIIEILRNFKQPELVNFQPLLQDYLENWQPNMVDNDLKRLFDVLLQKIQSVQEEVESVIKPETEFKRSKVNDLAFTLEKLPFFIKILLKIFTHLFYQRYQNISKFISIYLKGWLDKDLCQYWSGNNETSFVPKRSHTSRPDLLINNLAQSINEIKSKVEKEQQKQLSLENNSNGSDSGDQNSVSDMLKDGQSQFEQRISQIQSFGKRSTLTDAQQDIRNVLARVQKLESDYLSLKSYYNEFAGKLLGSISTICRSLHLEPVLNDVAQDLFYNLENFKVIVKPKLEDYRNKYKFLRESFWLSLQNLLDVMINFVNKDFLNKIFHPQILLRPIQPNLGNIIQKVIPNFESVQSNNFIESSQEIKDQLQKWIDDKYGSPQERIDRKDTKSNYDYFNELVQDAKKIQAELKREEDQFLDDQILQKVKMLSDLVASDTFILFPNFEQTFKPLSNKESLQEEIAAQISKSVFNHIKLFKNSNISEKKEKGTNIGEMIMYYLYRIQDFENKLACFFNQENLLAKPVDGKMSVLLAGEIPPLQEEGPVDDLNSPGEYLAEEVEVLFDDLNQVIIEVVQENEEVKDLGTNFGKKSIAHRSNFQPTTNTGLNLDNQRKGSLAASQRVKNNVTMSNNNKMMDSMKFDLGARTDVKEKDLDVLTLQFENGQEKRIASFLRDSEEVFSKAKDLDKNDLEHVRRLKERYISLFQVITMQHLHNLTQNSFVLHYQNRAGCLDRLIKEVRQARTAYATKLDDFEFFFKLKGLQSIEQISKYIINFLCSPENKKYIQNLSDKYTYKSIVSQTWLLQLNLWAEEAKQHFDFQKRMSLFYKDDSGMQKIAEELHTRVQIHSQNQELLWNHYADMGDMILPEESNVIYTGIQEIVKDILKEDLEDASINPSSEQLVNELLTPLAQIYAKIDELHYKCRQKLSSSVLTNFEKLICEVVAVEKNVKQQVLNDKRRRICQYFTTEYEKAVKNLPFFNEDFKEKIATRQEDLKKIKQLYLLVNQYEFKKNSSDNNGNLLAQLICFNELMEKLQQHNLSVSFQSHVNLKYKSLIDNIEKKLRDDFETEQEKAKLAEEPCERSYVLVADQMKEVRAFMYVQDYVTYKNAKNAGELKALANKHVTQSIDKIDKAVEQLVLKVDDSNIQGGKWVQNQFFDVALNLLSEKRSLLENSYDFDKVKNVLRKQIEMYDEYERFEQKNGYCQYYRVQIEQLLPPEIQVGGRIFIYRTPFGYNQEFLKNDILLLLSSSMTRIQLPHNSQSLNLKLVKPLTSQIKEKYGIAKETMKLSEVGEGREGSEISKKFDQYYLDNFTRHFFLEGFQGSDDIANFKDEYTLTIYEVKNEFPAITMIQTVQKVTELKVSRVRIQQFEVEQIRLEIQRLLRNDQIQTAAGNIDEQERAKNLQNTVQKYITNDDVQGGLKKVVETFFNEKLIGEFTEQEDVIKRAYLELYKTLSSCYQELFRLVEVLELYFRNSLNVTEAQNRMQERQKILEQKSLKFNLAKLQDNF